VAYLALHSIDGLDILTGEKYIQKGGGNFARWQQHIIDWHGNLYEGVKRAPAVGETEYLVLSTTGPQPLRELGLTPFAMCAVAMEKFPEHRWLAKAGRDMIGDIGHLTYDVHIYAPMTSPPQARGERRCRMSPSTSRKTGCRRKRRSWRSRSDAQRSAPASFGRPWRMCMSFLSPFGMAGGIRPLSRSSIASNRSGQRL